jgi:hypothetical protein
MEWKDGNGFSEVLVSKDGEILGEVRSAIGTGYIASRADFSKRYYTREQAKRAIETLARNQTVAY